MRTLTGVRIGGTGEYTDADGATYRGQANDAKADGVGVLTLPDGATYSGEWSAGVMHGHAVYRFTDGAVGYDLCDRGNVVLSASVDADGACGYDYEDCAADDARLLALTAAALDAAVRPCHWPAASDHRVTRSRCAAALSVRSGHGAQGYSRGY
jgi:hypothetical protein